MIEIAISLAVIGFALVAIIGILPAGMQVQKDNRQETIINQDMSVWLDAIRTGARGLDDLTNYVSAITNYSTQYFETGNPRTTTNAYKYADAWINATRRSDLAITNGMRIVGLLSTPRYIDVSLPNNRSYLSNYVVAYVRSMSGNAGEKFPQTNSSMQDLSFNYRMVSEVASAAYYDPQWTNYSAFPTNAPEYQARLNYAMVATNLQNNLHDLRLVFRWPLFDNNVVGNGWQTYRTMVGGHLMRTNHFTMTNLYFFQNRNYVKAL